jgi:hypothetical protein
MKVSLEVENFYNENQDMIETAWEDHLSFGEFGSGEDRINITDDMFWEFVEDYCEL